MTTPQPPNPAAPPSDTTEPRIATLSGDRMCTKCCFSLTGQTITRERHYGLLIVRCPECGTPAALQEYPVLGRWAGRFGYLVAAGWLLSVFALVVVSAAVLWGIGEEVAQSLARPYQEHVTRLWTERAAANAGPSPTAPGWPNPNWQADQAWRNSLDKGQMFREAGGWSGAISWQAIWLVLYMVLVLTPLGAAFALAAPHMRWKGRVAVLAIALVLASLFMVVSFLQSGRYMAVYYNNGWGAWRDIVWRVAPIALGCGLLCFAVGLWSGRALARGLVLLLPPRLRAPLAFLWIVDGRPLPK